MQNTYHWLLGHILNPTPLFLVGSLLAIIVLGAVLLSLRNSETWAGFVEWCQDVKPVWIILIALPFLILVLGTIAYAFLYLAGAKYPINARGLVVLFQILWVGNILVFWTRGIISEALREVPTQNFAPVFGLANLALFLTGFAALASQGRNNWQIMASATVIWLVDHYVLRPRYYRGGWRYDLINVSTERFVVRWTIRLL